MEKLTQSSQQKSNDSFKDFNDFLQGSKRQFIRSTIAFYEPIPLFWKYITTPGKKSPLKDFWKYLMTPYPDSVFEDPKE